jgi:hypothetical protein
VASAARDHRDGASTEIRLPANVANFSFEPVGVRALRNAMITEAVRSGRRYAAADLAKKHEIA